MSFNAVVVLACLGSAVGLAVAMNWAGQTKRVKLAPDVLDSVATTQVTTKVTAAPGETLPPNTDIGPIPPTENYLLVGSDSRSCIDPKSPYAGAFLADGSGLGARTDTILVIRVDPSTNAVLLLSFPRDLWVHIGGHDGRINTAWGLGPARLIKTIKDNFNIPINHYIDVDFCAFKGLVDAVGGVSVPFSTPVRDLHTGLNVQVAGCHQMLGDEALAYARSRYFEYYDPKTKKWTEDPSTDYGRIRRQQDFIRRALHRALDKATNPSTIIDLIHVGLQNVKVDETLTFEQLYNLARHLRSLDPNTVQTFTLEGQGIDVNGQSVIRPLNNTYNRTVLDIFRGKAVLSSVTTATDSQTTTTYLPPATTGAPASTVKGSKVTTTIGPTTIPVVTVPTTLSPSITPPADPTCR